MPLKIGEEFTPWRKFKVACVPLPMMQSTVVTGNAKIVFACLLRHAGKRAYCWPAQATLALECGLTRDQVRYALGRLLKEKLIRVRHKQGGSNGYKFLWHALYEVGESFPRGGVGNSQGLGNGSPLKESIREGSKKEPELGTGSPSTPSTKEPPDDARLILVPRKPAKKPPASECAHCGGTGWRETQVKGIPAVTRCGCKAKGA